MATRTLPQADSNSTTHSTGPVVGEANNSRNAGGVGRGDLAAGGNRFFNRV
jgi:hypothetical protein